MCLTAIATGAFVFGKLYEGAAQAEAQRRAAAIDDQNAKVADALSLDALRSGDLEAWKIRERGARIIGTQRVAFAAGHVDPTSGSAAEVQAGTAGVTEFAAQLAKLNGMRAAYGYKAQGVSYRMQASARRAAADDYLVGAILSAGGAVAGAAAFGGAGGGKTSVPTQAASEPGISYPTESGVPFY